MGEVTRPIYDAHERLPRRRPIGRSECDDRQVPNSVAELLDLLELEQLEVNLYRGRQPDTRLQRVFGGQVAAQALRAACDTVDAA